jgi:hypothetical protein
MWVVIYKLQLETKLINLPNKAYKLKYNAAVFLITIVFLYWLHVVSERIKIKESDRSLKNKNSQNWSRFAQYYYYY